jgi:hypothetical protein
VNVSVVQLISRVASLTGQNSHMASGESDHSAPADLFASLRVLCSP